MGRGGAARTLSVNLASAIVGVILGRRSGAFDELGDAEPGDLAPLLRDALSDHKNTPGE